MDCRVRSLGLVVLTGAILTYLGCVAPGGYYGGGPAVSSTEANVDRPGSDFSNTVQANAHQCRALCLSTAACAAWTWVKPGVQGPNPRCYLKNSAPPPVSNTCCVSGAKTGGGPSPMPGGLQYNTDRPGSDFSNTVQANANQCRSMCMSTAGCAAWTWVKPGVQGPNPRCYLKNSAPPPVSNTCCVSGVK